MTGSALLKPEHSQQEIVAAVDWEQDKASQKSIESVPFHVNCLPLRWCCFPPFSFSIVSEVWRVRKQEGNANWHLRTVKECPGLGGGFCGRSLQKASQGFVPSEAFPGTWLRASKSRAIFTHEDYIYIYTMHVLSLAGMGVH